MKTQNLAILLTDIAGFTAATARQTRDENATWLSTHSSLLRPVFDAFGGQVRKEMGDAFLVTFPSPTDAVLCGTAVLDRLWAHNRGAPPLMRLTVRVVVNMGEVRVDKAEILGEPVNVAARVEEVADGGDVTLTEAVFLTMNRSEVEMEPLGPRDLPGGGDPVTLYRVKQVVPRVVMGEVAQSYPYGGAQLHRLGNVTSRPSAVMEDQSGRRLALRNATQNARDQLSLAQDAVNRLGGWPAVARLGVMAALTVAVLLGAKMGFDAWQKKQADPFRVIEDRVAAKDLHGASDAWDQAVKKGVQPQWKLDYLLGRISALEGKCDDVMEAYMDAVKQQEVLREDAILIRDVVRCVDAPDGRPARFVRKWVGRKDGIPLLRELALDSARGPVARLTALALAEELGGPDAVPQTGVLVEILQGDHPCKVRREAVLRLSARKDVKALEPLQRELKDSEGEGKRVKANSCLLGVLGEAVRGIESR
jgi:adenylate cyclase